MTQLAPAPTKVYMETRLARETTKGYRRCKPCGKTIVINQEFVEIGKEGEENHHFAHTECVWVDKTPVSMCPNCYMVGTGCFCSGWQK